MWTELKFAGFNFIIQNTSPASLAINVGANNITQGPTRNEIYALISKQIFKDLKIYEVSSKRRSWIN